METMTCLGIRRFSIIQRQYNKKAEAANNRDFDCSVQMNLLQNNHYPLKYILLQALIIMRGEEQGKKKKGQKRGEKVPFQELGFKAKVYYGIQTEYRRQRARYKAAKYGAENNKECFMGRLRFTLNVAELSNQELDNLASFKGIKRGEWAKVRQIVYHSKQQPSCAICLQKNFQAPQMTSCGHVFCWHCILMHYYKSLKACFCPVCNQSYEIDNIVSCQPVYTKAFKELENNRVSFVLKARKEGDSRVYDPFTFAEDLNFARVARATPERILKIFEQERDVIEQNIQTCDDEQIKKWMEKVHSLSWSRIEKAQAIIEKKMKSQFYSNQKNQHHRDHLESGYIHSVLDEKQRGNLIKFYEQKSGRLIFMHPLCDKMLRKSQSELPQNVQQQIVYWQEAEYNVDLLRKYKNISHITVNQQIDLIIVNIEKLIGQALIPEFQEQLIKFKQKKKEELQRQERQAQRLSVRYEEEKQYLARLKKLQESQFFDIKVPTTIDISQLENSTFFPSLIQTRSMPEPEIEPEPAPKSKQPTKKQQVKIINEGDFPELFTKKQPLPVQETQIQIPKEVMISKSEQTPIIQVVKQDEFPSLQNEKKHEGGHGHKKKNKKKQKFVNVTSMFFTNREEDQQQ